MRFSIKKHSFFFIFNIIQRRDFNLHIELIIDDLDFIKNIIAITDIHELVEKIAFNRECINLDPTRMDSDVIEHNTMKGAEKKVRKRRYCLSEKNELYWIYDCPEDCQYFVPK